ncbi:MAG: hypothetical protein BWY74_03464 [Firmicutes bacterium ADurb.Bin419]|nr:MAG: hypothetical protein BWY74_03464 [Firmicutes bacterium ADurb.Bin419]
MMVRKLILIVGYVGLISILMIYLSSCSAKDSVVNKKVTENISLDNSKEAPDTKQSEDVSNDFKEYNDEIRGIKFKYPFYWSVEDIKEQNIILLMSPDIEKDWQANIFIEINSDLEKRTIDKQMDNLIQNLSETKKKFSLEDRKIITTKTGLPAGCFIYTHGQDVALKEMEYLIQLGNNEVLFATASIEQSLWEKYLTKINLVFDSIELLNKE